METSKINISFINEKLLDTIYSNTEKVTDYINNNPHSSAWLKELLNEPPFEQRKQMINDFELEISQDGKYKNVEYDNAIKLYENLKDLPRYVLVDDRLWLWLEFGKFYRVAIQAMPLTTQTRLGYSWLFAEGKRGLWRNAFSRSYYWVEFTVDESRNDKYELTKFVFEKTERIRHLTFDNKYRNIVLCTIRAEKDIYDKYSSDPEYKETIAKCERGIETYNIYTYIRKAISLYGSARILDFMADDDLYNMIYAKLEKAVEEVHKGNLEYLKK